MVNQGLDDNALKISRKNTTSFTGKNSRSMTIIDDNEEHERVSLSSRSLNIENETTLTSDTKIKEGKSDP